MHISAKMRSLGLLAEEKLKDIYEQIDEISRLGTEKVLDIFREEKVSESMFAPSTGYGYGDAGRDAIDRITAKIFGGEAGFMRPSIISGTHALTVGLFALLRPGDVMLSITSSPYDTLREVIGADSPDGSGSLADFGIGYRETQFSPDGKIDFQSVGDQIGSIGEKLKVVFLQRSRGYLNRPTLTVSQIAEAVKFVKNRAAHDLFVVVDNCYGEFTETIEPAAVGADMIIGSLIKNPGGGMADVGGYIVGSNRAVELAGYRLCCPGVGLEAGASLGQNRNMLRGLFYAPHTVAQAMKTAHLAAFVFSELGYEVSPGPFDRRSDIIQTIKLETPERLIKFCKGIQSASPVDAHVSPEPWAMPGYSDQVIMASGAFVGGASIELSADGPLRPPYTAFLQGALTYESGRLGILAAAELCEKR